MSQAGWEKLGPIFEPQPVHEKLLTHAANPVAVPRGASIYRIYYSGRDAQKRSSVGHFDFDMDRFAIVDMCSAPAFTHGEGDDFYSHGVSVGCHYAYAGREYILFMGWHVPAGGHWRGEIGRLEIKNGGILTLEPREPVLAISAADPTSLSYPWVESAEGGGWTMWYGSTLAWDAGNGEMLHVIRRASSADGLHWTAEGDAVPHQIGLAQAFSRPTVAKGEDGALEMWFSYRGGSGQTYRIGNATSRDGIGWSLRLKEASIDVSASGWDSEMIEYPFVFEHEGRQFMLYNGNGYGESGIGLAARRGSVSA